MYFSLLMLYCVMAYRTRECYIWSARCVGLWLMGRLMLHYVWVWLYVAHRMRNFLRSIRINQSYGLLLPCIQIARIERIEKHFDPEAEEQKEQEEP